jgi:uncharacterized membrane protein YeaQ/YmgE (transglycosylase-associated protein family)
MRAAIAFIVRSALLLDPCHNQCEKGADVTWTFMNLAIQILGGMVGAHVAAAVAHEQKLGFLSQTVLGALGGGLSGCFLQTLAVSVVTESGSLNELRPVEQVMLQALTGLAAGGIATLAIIIIMHSIEQHKHPKP